MAETDVHVEELTVLLETLKERYRQREDVYVAGNNFLYYEEGEPSSRVSPDTYVVFGVPKRQRRTYRLWQEGRAPDVVFEMTSKSTKTEDLATKKELYAHLGVTEYFLFDPLGDYLRPSLQGYRLQDREYRPIAPDEEGRLSSQTLDLYIHREGRRLRLIDADTGNPLLRPEEAYHARQSEENARRAAEARAAREESVRREAEARAAREESVRREAEARAAESEAELQRLREELARLKGS